MTLLRWALRRHRAAALWIAVAAGLVALSMGPGFVRVAGDTPAARAQFGQTLAPLAQQFALLLPPPARPDTLGGFLQWRAFGTLAMVFAVWGVLAGAGAARGDEDRGLTEQWLAAGRSRRAVLATRAGAFALASSLAVGAAVLGAQLGALAVREPLPTLGLAAQGLALEGLALCCFALSALLAQLARDGRGAAGLAGGVVGGLFLLNGVSRLREGLATLRLVSPFAHYDRTRGLAPDGALGLASSGLLYAASAALLYLAAEGFVRRDLGAPLWSTRRAASRVVRAPARGLWLQGSVRLQCYEQRYGLALWILGGVALGAAFAVLGEQMATLLARAPELRAMLFAERSASPAVAFLARGFAMMFELLLAIFAVTQVARWIREESEGRLELLLATPLARWQVVRDRAAALGLTATLLAAAATGAVLFFARRSGVPLEPAHALSALLGFVLFALFFGALGAALGALAPRRAVGLLTAFAVGSSLLQQFGALFGLPAWLLRGSVFGALGPALAGDLSAPRAAALAAVSLAGFVFAAWSLGRRDLAR